MKPIVYIETTIPSYYFDCRSSLQFEIQRTREWWDVERFAYELITSEAVIDELDDPRNPNRENCLRLLEDVPVAKATLELARIAEVYTIRGIMPERKLADALHLAFASSYRADFLLTWNCRHLANPHKFSAIRQINSQMGLYIPTLTTPYQLRKPAEEGEQNEDA